MKRIILLLIIFLNLIFNPVIAFASESCSNRYLTLVNPVRGRSLWINPSLNALISQYTLIHNHKFSGTWLLQYNTLKDTSLLAQVKQMDRSQQLGVLLEVSKELANDSDVIYPVNIPWYRPNVVFLSGYTQSDRRRLIDVLFAEFKQQFGYYPESVGAWWIDSYSLQYMNDKYHITSALIVADQKTTDNYGVWGQWWGVPYYPSKANILMPATSMSNKLPVTIIQWAQRDPMLATGSGTLSSNYSLQANDYTSEGQNTSFFKNLASLYLDCKNPVGQITVGLETGMEGSKFMGEYKNQLDYLAGLRNLQSVTMNEFAQKFTAIYPRIVNKIEIEEKGFSWKMTPLERTSNFTQETITYNPNLAFADYFVPDNKQFLNRTLPISGNTHISFIGEWVLIVSLMLLGIGAFKFKKLEIFIISLIFSFASFGLIIRSFSMYGWHVFFGPVVPFVGIFKVLLIFASFLMFLGIAKLKLFSKDSKRYLLLIPLCFGLDELLKALRFTYLNGSYYLGILLPHFRLVGLGIKKPFSLSIASLSLPSYQAGALLRFDLTKVWNNLVLSIVVYPLAHIAIAVLAIYVLTKLNLPKKLTFPLVVVLICLFVWHLQVIITVDPRLVLPQH